MLLLPFFSREDTTILKSRCARCAPPPELNAVAFALRHSRAQRMNPSAPFIYIGAEGSIGSAIPGRPIDKLPTLLGHAQRKPLATANAGRDLSFRTHAACQPLRNHPDKCANL